MTLSGRNSSVAKEKLTHELTRMLSFRLQEVKLTILT